MNNLRVCHLVHDLALGGLENQLLRIIRATDDPSISYIVAHVGSDRSMVPEFEEAGARVVHLDTGSPDPLQQFRPRSMLHLLGFLRNEAIDVLHCHGSLYQHVLGRICGQVARCAVVGTYHTRRDSFHRSTQVLERLTRPLSAVNIAVSKGVERSYTDSARVYDPSQRFLRRRSYTVYNGIDVLQFESRVSEADPAQVDTREADTNGVVFLNVGRYTELKNQRRLIAAMERVVAVQPDAHLFLVGWGELEKPLRELVAELGIEENVTITGRVSSEYGQLPSVYEYYALADAFVLPSFTEGLSVVLLEAMAAGLGIVASKIPGTTEVVVDGETGLLVSPDSTDELADAMKQMLDADRRGRFGGRGQERVLNTFHIRNTVDAYVDIYRRFGLPPEG